MHWSEHDNYDLDYDDYNFNYNHELMKDLTACDKKCKYCKNCDY